MMLVQIYELQSVHEALLMAELGVDHVGVLVGKGAYPRELAFDPARAIFRALPPGTKGLALSLAAEVQEILEVIASTRPDILHLGTLPENLPPEDMQTIRAFFPELEIMRSIPVQDESAIRVACSFAPVSDLLLLDSHAAQDDQIGATGVTHDWSISKRIVQSLDIPVLLAGGLGPDNVLKAIEAVQPAGVDSKTRTDRPGTHRKDPEQVKRFVRLAKSSR